MLIWEGYEQLFQTSISTSSAADSVAIFSLDDWAGHKRRDEHVAGLCAALHIDSGCDCRQFGNRRAVSGPTGAEDDATGAKGA